MRGRDDRDDYDDRGGPDDDFRGPDSFRGPPGFGDEGGGGGTRRYVHDARHVIGADQARPKFLTWLQRLVKHPDTSELWLHLERITKYGDPQPVDRFIYNPELGVEDTVEQIMSAACENVFTAEFKGKLRYLVSARGLDSRFQFTLSMPADEDDDDDLESADDEPTKRGLLAQSMGMATFFAKLFANSKKSDQKLIMEIMRDQRAELESHRSNQFQNMKQAAHLMNMTWMRDLEIRKVHSQERRHEEMLGMGKQALQLVGHKVMGAAAGGPHPLDNLIATFTGSITPEQFEQLQKIFGSNPMQIATIMELINYVEAKRQQAQAQGGMPGPAHQNPNGQHDAGPHHNGAPAPRNNGGG